MGSEEAVKALAALAQETRLAVFRLLVRAGPDGMNASEVARRLSVVPSTLSGHLSILKAAGLLVAQRRAREIYYAADLARLNLLLTFLLSDCCDGKIENCSEILSLLGGDGRD